LIAGPVGSSVIARSIVTATTIRRLVVRARQRSQIAALVPADVAGEVRPAGIDRTRAHTLRKWVERRALRVTDAGSSAHPAQTLTLTAVAIIRTRLEPARFCRRSLPEVAGLAAARG